MKRLLFFFMILVACFSQASAHLAVDTTIFDNDSTRNNVALNDPRKAFKDLFVSNIEKSGSSRVELNPMAISFVQDYIARHTKQLEQMRDWGKPYFDMMQGVLNSHGLPGELKYLAVIESDLKSNALSWAGAVGPWQFMPGTARKLGLRVSAYVDERTDYYKSTNAAARYLADLYSIYGDWLLVIAAYNGGAANVNYAIRKSRSRNFWSLQYYLPEESRNHVKKFIATHYIMEGTGGITTVTRDEAKDLSLNSAATGLTTEELNSLKNETITGKYSSVVISQNILMDINNFNRYNPDFDKQIGMNGTFDLRLPPDKMDLFNAKKYDILDQSMRLLLAPVTNSNK